jgi:cyanate lyase
MVRKIGNVYEYYNYRQLINDDYLLRSKQNHSYSFRAFSRDLGLSAGFLTDVLNRKKDLGAKTGQKVFANLGFKDKDLIYCNQLLLSESKSNLNDRNEAQNYVNKHYRHVGYVHDAKAEKVVASPEHLIAYSLARVCSDISAIEKAFVALELPERKVIQVLRELEEQNLVVIREGQVHVVEMLIKIAQAKNLAPCIQQFSNQIQKKIVKEGIEIPNRVAQASILNFDENTFLEAVDAHKFFIKKLNRLGIASKKPTILTLLSTSFLAIPWTPPEKPNRNQNQNRET